MAKVLSRDKPGARAHRLRRHENAGALAACFFAVLVFLFVCDVAAIALDDASPKPSAAAEGAESIITKEETIDTRVGEKRLVRTGAKILDVSVTRPDVAEVFAAEAQGMIVSANSPGIGRAIVRLSDGERMAYTIRVYVADPEKFAAELRQEIGGIQGINIEVVKGRILVDGRVLSLNDMDAIERAIGDNPSITNLTSLSSRNARILSREIEKEFRESGIYGARVEVRGNRVTLVGSLGSELLVRKAERIASSYTTKFDNLIKIAQDSQAGKARAK
ncbi:pilus assembly protein N-terminal domain-containing protein [Candidatus Poribacteria bacterium]|nr:pilus assembly protein N-terminal domain-containing protein [Candidatus Poribacteria bacterium]